MPRGGLELADEAVHVAVPQGEEPVTDSTVEEVAVAFAGSEVVPGGALMDTVDAEALDQALRFEDGKGTVNRGQVHRL